VPGDKQETPARLCQSAQFTAVMHVLRYDIAVGIEKLDDLIEQVPASGADAGNVLQQEEFRRIVCEGFQHQPQTPNGQTV